jgi:single-strand DNA-binding protein
MIVVEGTLRNNNYQDKNHPDVTHYTMDVLVDNVEFAGDKGGQTSAPAPQQADPQQIAQTEDYSDLSDFEEILSDGPTPF